MKLSKIVIFIWLIYSPSVFADGPIAGHTEEDDHILHSDIRSNPDPNALNNPPTGNTKPRFTTKPDFYIPHQINKRY